LTIVFALGWTSIFTVMMQMKYGWMCARRNGFSFVLNRIIIFSVHYH
jgi:hypothetical protein